MLTVMEHIEHPFGRGNLTATGAQYSAEATSVLGTYKTVETIEFSPPSLGKILEIELGITWSQKADGATDKGIGIVQVRDKVGTWNDAMTAVTNATAGTAYEEWTYSGRLSLATHDVEFPIGICVQVKSNGTTDNAVGKVKNSSYVKVLYSTS